MITALNMTMPIKQDAETQQELKKLKAIFADHVQPKIDEALKKSELVHFARVLVIDDKYIQVITEFDGDKENYTEFFRTELNEVFKAIFALLRANRDGSMLFEKVKSWEPREPGHEHAG